MCFMGAARVFSDQRYMSFDHKASCKGDSDHHFKGKSVLHKSVSPEAFH